MESHELIGTSAEELELLKLVDLQRLIEEAAGESLPKSEAGVHPPQPPSGKPRATDSLFDRELRQELAAEKHERLRLFDELDRVKKILNSKTSELENQQKRIEVLAQEAEQAKGLLREREEIFTKMLQELERAHVKSIQDERATLDQELAKEKLAADEILAREATFRIQIEKERKEYEEKIAFVTSDLAKVRAEIGERDKRTANLKAEFDKTTEQLADRSQRVDRIEARLKIVEAEKTLLSSDIEQRKRVFAAQILDRESGLRKTFESEKEALIHAFESEKVDLSAKLLREKAVRETLEHQKQTYSEKMIELAWELKERERTALRVKAKAEAEMAPTPVPSTLLVAAAVVPEPPPELVFEIDEPDIHAPRIEPKIEPLSLARSKMERRTRIETRESKCSEHDLGPTVSTYEAAPTKPDLPPLSDLSELAPEIAVVASLSKASNEAVSVPIQVEPQSITSGLVSFPQTSIELPQVNPALLAPSAVTASELRRLAAAVIDYLFVFTLWTIAVVLTANIFSGFSTGFSPKVFDEFAKPAFLRFVAVEYAGMWLFYFVASLGFANRTCGMWVWDIRVEYPSKLMSGIISRALRVMLSVVTFPLLFPILILGFRRNGRNILDFLSRSRVVLHESDVIRGQVLNPQSTPA